MKVICDYDDLVVIQNGTKRVYLRVRDSQGVAEAQCSPDHARAIAAELSRLADDLEAENRDLKAERKKCQQ